MAVRGLDDFHPKAGAKRAVQPDTFYSGSNQYPGYVGPTDFATLYDLTPLYAESVTGVGVTVAIAAQSDNLGQQVDLFTATTRGNAATVPMFEKV